MDIKQKIQKLKRRSLELATLALTLFPSSGATTTVNSDKNTDHNKTQPSSELIASQSIADFVTDGIELNIHELKEIVDNNPDMELSADLLSAIKPGPSQKKIKSLLAKGFDYTVRNSRGESKLVKCSLNQSPKGYCYGALKHLLYKIYKEPKSNFLSAYQEKDKLLQSANFLAMPIELQDIENCPPSTVVVIPKCKGHKHGHIFTVVEKGVYCSDGKEVAGAYFENNYKSAKGIYAFIPVDASITLTPQVLQSSPKLYAAVLLQQTGKDIHPLPDARSDTPVMFAELSPAQKTKDFSR